GDFMDMLRFERLILTTDSHEHVFLKETPKLTSTLRLVPLLPHPLHRIPLAPLRLGLRVVYIPVTNRIASGRPVGVRPQPRDHAVFSQGGSRNPDLPLLLVHRGHQLK